MKKKGIGVGCMWYGIGNTAMPNPAGAYVDILDDGSVILQAGCADIGQGSSTILCQIVAEELGVPMDYIRIVSADTGVTPDGGATSASRQTYISGNAARLAAIDAKKHVLEEAAKQLDCSIDEMAINDGNYFLITDPDHTVSFTKAVLACRAKGQLTFGRGWFNPETTSLDLETGQGEPYATYAFATQVAEVEVDTETGKVEVLKIAAAHDVGRAINPINVIGQIEGGCAMGIGYALLEEVEINNGKIKNPNMSQYLIPTMLDMPEIYSVIVEETEITGPFGAKGVGEPALIPTAAAIANAVYDAIGVRITSLPITPEKVLEALNQKED
ncbi:MAG: nicotinate dehydrogenase medium molybdopterin subunit [Desulfitibacter sp. BRH_c19]|nr:MAG: nicotinate dehydrogenase medium molybdopterin subunit [Desulfitibacter sp. BRH_c19]